MHGGGVMPDGSTPLLVERDISVKEDFKLLRDDDSPGLHDSEAENQGCLDGPF